MPPRLIPLALLLSGPMMGRLSFYKGLITHFLLLNPCDVFIYTSKVPVEAKEGTSFESSITEAYLKRLLGPSLKLLAFVEDNMLYDVQKDLCINRVKNILRFKYPQVPKATLGWDLSTPEVFTEAFKESVIMRYYFREYGFSLIEDYGSRHGVKYEKIICMDPCVSVEGPLRVPKVIDKEMVYVREEKGREEREREEDRGWRIKDDIIYGTWDTVRKFIYKFLDSIGNEKFQEATLESLCEAYVRAEGIKIGNLGD